MKKIITSGEQKSIADALKMRGVRKPCPRCDSNSFEIMDVLIGMHTKQLKNQKKSQILPTIGIVCKQCGYLMLHLVEF